MLALACGGGADKVSGVESPSPSPSSPTALVYTNPTDSTAWRLTHDSASTPAHLILDLMAPSGASGQGVTLILTTDASKAAWHAFSSGSYLQGLVFSSPLVDVASVQGSALRIVAAQAPGTPVISAVTARARQRLAQNLRSCTRRGCSRGGVLGECPPA